MMSDPRIKQWKQERQREKAMEEKKTPLVNVPGRGIVDRNLLEYEARAGCIPLTYQKKSVDKRDKTTFDEIGDKVARLIDIFDIPPDHIETAGLAEHRRRKAMREKMDEVDEIIFSMGYPYASLREVLDRAYQQASEGKGKERHGGDKPFEDQPMQLISELIGTEKGCLFQAMKKIQESIRLDDEAAVNELLGAIVYLSGAIIYKEQNND